MAQALALVVGLAIAIPYEVARLLENARDGLRLSEWYVGFNVDTTLLMLLFLLLPIFWMARRGPVQAAGWMQSAWRNWFGPQTKPGLGGRGLHRAWVLALLVAATSFAMNAGVAQRFGIVPPAYHDEYSYLFQARTFLAGRLWFPSHPTAPELFDQMHVLNDGGHFASRYFPGAGAWIALSLLVGNPFLGHWLSGALCAFFVFWAGRELDGNLTGFLAGMLTALAPGLALFSNLLLAHHPTLLGLSLFLFLFLRMMRTHGWMSALGAGCGLSFAMLCRPMTAAGFALPFGVWFAGWWLLPWRGVAESMLRRTGIACALSAPLLAGMLLLFFYNRAITGSGWTTPYQLYTDIYTPRHVYGFNNIERGEQKLGPKVIESYDRWAKNLTPELAARNVLDRLVSSLSWTLGIIPLATALVVFVVLTARGDPRWWLIPASIVALHVAHVPYWFSGIMGWHYVFETTILWLLIFAGVSVSLLRGWAKFERPLMPVWYAAFIAAAMLPTFVAAEPFWPTSRLDNGADSILFSRLKYRDFYVKVQRVVSARPALVLIRHDESEEHIDYVDNDPHLDAEVLFGRLRPGGRSIAEIARLFPERTIYVFDAKDGLLLPATAEELGE